jgi:hypothetical protein
MSRSRFAAAALAAIGLATVPATATSFRMVSDRDLVDAADAVAVVAVLATAPAATAAFPATDSSVRVERLLAGALPGSVVTVRVPGGVDRAGRGLEVHGAPRFARGDRALLMLRDAGDGTYRPLHLMLGAFHLVEAEGRTLAVRDLADTFEATADGARPAAEPPRDLARFSRWIEDRALGIARGEDYRVEAKYGMLRDPADGRPIRWFQFDDGTPAVWWVHRDGQPGLGLERTVAAFQAGLALWTDDPGTNVDYRFGGTSSASAGLGAFDEINAIVFGDPGGLIDDFSCEEGGVLAIGGPWYHTFKVGHRGTRFHPAAGADVVVNDGTECFFGGDPHAAAELFAHELGHTLGLGHSADEEALMFGFIHEDGRGASATDDDREGLGFLYGDVVVSGRPARPTELVAVATSATTAELTWVDRADNEQSVRIEVRLASDPEFEEIGVHGPDTDTVGVVNLLPGRVYLYRVRSENAKGFSAYSNKARLKQPAR